MPKIKHCGHYRRTDNYWLNSDDSAFRYQILMTSKCPNCQLFVMEAVGVKDDLSFGSTRRIPQDKHDDWMERTKIGSGDLAEGLDSSQWKTRKAGVHWVNGSLGRFPYIKIKTRVE